jgi:hypothetical protein
MFSIIIYILVIAIGFMMGLLYKRTVTTAGFFNPNPAISLKIFTWVLAVGIVVTFGLSWYCLNSMKSTGIAEENNMIYTDSKSLMYFVLNLSFLLLIVSSNLYSQSLKKLAFAPYIFTFLFYAIFILKDAYYISSYHVIWLKSLKMLTGEMSDFTKTAWIKIIVGFTTTAFNAAMIWWGLRK